RLSSPAHARDWGMLLPAAACGPRSEASVRAVAGAAAEVPDAAVARVVAVGAVPAAARHAGPRAAAVPAAAVARVGAGRAGRAARRAAAHPAVAVSAAAVA